MQYVDYFSSEWIDFYNVIGTLGSHVAVPCFPMFSGFLYFYKLKVWNKSTYYYKTKKWIKTLIIPCFFVKPTPIFIYTIIEFIKYDDSFLSYLIGFYDVGIFKCSGTLTNGEAIKLIC